MLLLVPVATAAALDLGAFTESVRVQLDDAWPGCEVASPGVLRLDIACGPVEVSAHLGGLAERCEAAPEACDSERNLYRAMLAEQLAPAPAIQLEQLLPAVRRTAWLDALPPDARSQVVGWPLAGDLVVVWMVDSPRSARSATVSDMFDLELTPETVVERTLPALRNELGKVGRQDDRGVNVLGGSWYTSSLLLDDAYWAEVGAAGGPVHVAVPATDVLLYTTSPRRGVVRRLQKAAERMHEATERPLSALVYARVDGAWVVEE